MVWVWGAVVGSFGKLCKKNNLWHRSIKGPIHFKRMFHNFPCELQLVIRTVLLLLRTVLTPALPVHCSCYCAHACPACTYIV